ncbi:DUF4180 domain-containing protein [Burkholderia savannae]|uniref:DUF4180 domain-containing protein n=1 Tax=Burkholderia savannae TaxID=1637837 RepID=UPI0009E82AEA|nr:DUF4180 domain-containing protein [Burkholderia savannae]
MRRTARADASLRPFRLPRLREQAYIDFLGLVTRVAGHLARKPIHYRARLAAVGDIDAALARGRALRELVHETNRGDTFWFAADVGALAQRLPERSRAAGAH